MIHHTACRLLKDCHFEEYRKLGGASACFSTGFPDDWNMRMFNQKFTEIVQVFRTQVVLIQNNAIGAVEKALKAKYQPGLVSFAFCLLCIFVAILSFIKRLSTCYDHISFFIFILLCAGFYYSFRFYQGACQEVGVGGYILGSLCPTRARGAQSGSLPDWFYDANYFFSRVFFSLIALPIAVYRAIPQVEDSDQNRVLVMIKRYKDTLDVDDWMLALNKDKGERRRFFLHWIFVLAIIGCCFHRDDSFSFLPQTFALYDFFGLLMLALAVTNSIKRFMTAQKVSAPLPDLEKKQNSNAEKKQNSNAFEFFFLIGCPFATWFLPPNLVLLVVLALLHAPGMKPHDTNSQADQSKHEGNDSGIIAVDWDSNFFWHLKYHLAFFALLVLSFATRSFVELYTSQTARRHFLWILVMNLFCESFARAVSRKVFVHSNFWVALSVWLSFSFLFEYLLGLIGDAQPSAYVCIIVQVFLLNSICNLSPQKSHSIGCFFPAFECHIFPFLLRFLFLSFVALPSVPHPHSRLWYGVFAAASVCISWILRPPVGFARHMANIFISIVYVALSFACLKSLHMSKNFLPFRHLSNDHQTALHRVSGAVALLSLVCLASTSKFFSGSKLASCVSVALTAILGFFLFDSNFVLHN